VNPTLFSMPEFFQLLLLYSKLSDNSRTLENFKARQILRRFFPFTIGNSWGENYIYI
jgi:hypothetical protein